MLKELIELLDELPPGTTVRKDKESWYMYILHPRGIITHRHPEIGTCLANFIEIYKAYNESNT